LPNRIQPLLISPDLLAAELYAYDYCEEDDEGIILPTFFLRLVFIVDFGAGFAVSNRVSRASNFSLSTLVPTFAFFPYLLVTAQFRMQLC